MRWSGDGVPVERLRHIIRPMRAFAVIVAAAFGATAPAATPARAASGNSAAEYSLAVTRVCAGALLFDHGHDLGTRADALSVARDIRASTSRRLARVTALSAPPQLQDTSS